MRFSVVNPTLAMWYSRKIRGNIRHRIRNLQCRKEFFLSQPMNATEEGKHGLPMILATELKKGVELIADLDDLSYRRGPNASVGAQFRHNLDFAVCLLRGLASGHIDYNDRERDGLVETDRHHASERFHHVIGKLAGIEPRSLGRSVLIRSEIDKEIWLPSSLAREVEFVHSHTVHHHALIAQKLASIGIEITSTFGVAPSTLEYWHQKAA